MAKQSTTAKGSLGDKIGISEKNIDKVVGITAPILADVQALYIKTRGFHWNLVDPRFYFLHELLNEQYEALEEDADTIAERIRQIGRRAPGSFREFAALMTIQEVTKQLSGTQMLENLVHDYDYLIRTLRKAIDQTTSFEDFGTADMFTQILREFEKRAWILRSHLS